MSHRMLLTLADLPEGLLDRVVAALRQAEPVAVGVLVTGSYAEGRATSQSDLDVTVLTAVPALGHYRTWFEPRPGLPLHVSAGAASLADWVEEGNTAADWALGFPTEEVAAWAWATANCSGSFTSDTSHTSTSGATHRGPPPH